MAAQPWPWAPESAVGPARLSPGAGTREGAGQSAVTPATLGDGVGPLCLKPFQSGLLRTSWNSLGTEVQDAWSPPCCWPAVTPRLAAGLSHAGRGPNPGKCPRPLHDCTWSERPGLRGRFQVRTWSLGGVAVPPGEPPRALLVSQDCGSPCRTLPAPRMGEDLEMGSLGVKCGFPASGRKCNLNPDPEGSGTKATGATRPMEGPQRRSAP